MDNWKILRSYGVSPWRYRLLAKDVTVGGGGCLRLEENFIIVKHR